MPTENDSKYYWNAGDMGCGELILKLRQKVRALESGEEFKLIAEDPGAIEDLPAWSRMTGHSLVVTDHPTYIFKRK